MHGMRGSPWPVYILSLTWLDRYFTGRLSLCMQYQPLSYVLPHMRTLAHTRMGRPIHARMGRIRIWGRTAIL